MAPIPSLLSEVTNQIIIKTTAKQKCKPTRFNQAKSQTQPPQIRSPPYEKDIDINELSRICQEKLGVMPRPFQLKAAEAILTGKDCILNVPTGGGKTLAFFLPLLYRAESRRTILVVSPLTALMMDQVHAVNEYRISAAAICKETLSKDPNLLRTIASGVVSVVFVSPEEATSARFHKEVLSKSTFASLLIAIAIDEAHCISEWGGNFRPEYSQLGLLRGRVRSGLPILVASATIPLEIIKDIQEKLRISPSAVLVEMSNDRPNVALSVRPLVHPDETFADLAFVIPRNVREKHDIPCQLAYFNSRSDTEDAADALRAMLPPNINSECIAFYHSRVGDNRKRSIESQLTKGDIRILCCTDAVGIGCDIRGVKRVILWKLPPTFCALAQRAGRAARNLAELGEAILFEPFKKHQTNNIIQTPQRIYHPTPLDGLARRRDWFESNLT